jgi:hypothetical protein
MADKKASIDFDEKLNILQLKYEEKQRLWNITIEKLSKNINCELKKSIKVTADTNCQRQIMIDERTKEYYKVYKNMPKLKKMKKTLFEYYSSKYPYKSNGAEKQRLIEADVSYQDANMDFLLNYINYLTDSLKSFDQILYAMKNKIDLYNATGLD